MNPDNYSILGRGHFLSKTGQCKVWDKNTDGYCRADGIGSVVIKRLEDAEADNDNIIATVLGGATNHSSEAISITHPHAGTRKDNYNQVMKGAGRNPLDVSYRASRHRYSGWRRRRIRVSGRLLCSTGASTS